MRFSQLISEFSERTGIQLSGDPDSGEPLQTVFDDNTALQIVPVARNTLRLESRLALEGDEMRTKLVTLLKGSLATLSSRQSSITLDRNGEVVIHFQNLAVGEMTVSKFVETVEAFLHSHEVFQRGIATS